jgi:hypothetical protein
MRRYESVVETWVMSQIVEVCLEIEAWATPRSLDIDQAVMGGDSPICQAATPFICLMAARSSPRCPAKSVPWRPCEASSWLPSCALVGRPPDRGRAIQATSPGPRVFDYEPGSETKFTLTRFLGQCQRSEWGRGCHEQAARTR